MFPKLHVNKAIKYNEGNEKIWWSKGRWPFVMFPWYIFFNDLMDKGYFIKKFYNDLISQIQKVISIMKFCNDRINAEGHLYKNLLWPCKC